MNEGKMNEIPVWTCHSLRELRACERVKNIIEHEGKKNSHLR